MTDVTVTDRNQRDSGRFLCTKKCTYDFCIVHSRGDSE